MKRALLFFAMLLYAAPAFGRMPELNIDRVCKARAADAKILRSVPIQNMADCVHDEENAKQQLGSLWEKAPAPTRKLCESDARALGTTSYRDLLTCVQMADDLKSGPKKEAEKH